MNRVNNLNNLRKYFSPERLARVFKITRDYEKANQNYDLKQFQNFEQSQDSEQSKNLEKLHRGYSLQACKFFSSLNKIYGINGQYALNGGEHHIKEFRYRIDYFNLKIKVIIEWDEEYHYVNDKLRDEDIVRQERIQALYPSFTFLRIREKRFFEPLYIKRILDTLSGMVKFGKPKKSNI